MHKYRLKEIAKFNVNSLSKKFNFGSIAYLDTGNLTNGKISEYQYFDLKSDSIPSRARRLVKNNSILYSTVRPNQRHFGIIKTDNVPDNIVVSTGFAVIDVNETIADPNYVYYFLQQHEVVATLSAVAEQSVSAYPSIKASDIGNLEITLPDLVTQKKIAQILQSFDKKILVNEKINDNLLALASTLFDQEVGKSGTNERKLGQIVDIHDSKRIPLSSRQRENMEKTYPYYGAASKMDYVDKYLFDGIYLLLGEDGTVISEKGFPILQYVWGKFWVNNHAHVLTGRNEITTEILYLLLSKTSVKNIVTGAVQPKINQENLKSLKVVLPSEKIIKELSNKIAPLFKLYRLQSEENKRLEKLRDILLSKLF